MRQTSWRTSTNEWKRVVAAKQRDYVLAFGWRAGANSKIEKQKERKYCAARVCVCICNCMPSHLYFSMLFCIRAQKLRSVLKLFCAALHLSNAMDAFVGIHMCVVVRVETVLAYQRSMQCIFMLEMIAFVMKFCTFRL